MKQQDGGLAASMLAPVALGAATPSNELRTTTDFADVFSPEIIDFLREVRARRADG